MYLYCGSDQIENTELGCGGGGGGGAGVRVYIFLVPNSKCRHSKTYEVPVPPPRGALGCVEAQWCPGVRPLGEHVPSSPEDLTAV